MSKTSDYFVYKNQKLTKMKNCMYSQHSQKINQSLDIIYINKNYESETLYDRVF